MPRRPDGRIEQGQRLSTAISARAWNRAQDAADIVLGERTGALVTPLAGRVHLLGKTSAAWVKGTAQNITLWAGALGSEQQTSDVVRAWNKFADVPSGRWVMLARANDYWYVIAAECN
jgi:cobalamin biosynthesis protein CobT